DMRYLGQGFEIAVALPGGDLSAARAPQIHETFIQTYQEVYGRTIGNGTPELISLRLTASLPATPLTLRPSPAGYGLPYGKRQVYLQDLGVLGADVYDRDTLDVGAVIRGPAVFEERETSCGIGPDCVATIDAHHNLVIDIDAAQEGRNP